MDEASIIMYLKAISVLLLIFTFCTLWIYSFDCDSRVFPIVWGASVIIFIGLGIYLSFDDIYEDNNQIYYRVIQNGDYYRVHCLQLSDSMEIPDWKPADSFSWRLSREEAQNDLRQFVRDKQLKRVVRPLGSWFYSFRHNGDMAYRKRPG